MLSIISKFLPHIAGGIVGILVLAATIFYGLWQDEKAHSAALEANGKLQVAEYRAAYSRAVAIAYAEKNTKEAHYEKARQTSAVVVADLSGKLRAAVMRKAGANPRSAIRPDLPGDTEGPRLSQPSPNPPGFFIGIDDALKTADLASYAMGCFTWAKGLQEPAQPAIP